MSQPRPSRRPAPVEADELDTTAWGRQSWLALLVIGVLVAAVAGSGLLVKHALEPAVPAALAGCATSTQIGHPEVAPVTVNNFVVLAIHGYYNGLTFWRSEDWVVQGGDPRGDGRGGPGYDLPDEPTATPWDVAAVGMARVPGGAVNGSQFFIEKAPWPASGPTAIYNRFGTVTSGMDKVQLLTAGDTVTSITIKVS